MITDEVPMNVIEWKKSSNGHKKGDPMSCKGCGKWLTTSNRSWIKDRYGNLKKICRDCDTQCKAITKALSGTAYATLG